ncbi:protein phosphatase 2C [Nitzschia inconspicua]|uniref:protein-serine/threonine phosphatase n=1 Tax=Nitzschia inconspicua TaxID=303405 RepID=A0A9K3LBV2_9STRA|nr:protein phosphatase 2C [Nitzschia inconspicua]
MGTYLSTPVTEKCEESGESLDCPEVPCAWGVVDMQGWRKSMEDAHTAETNILLPKAESGGGGGGGDDAPISDAKVFGVFDGHGGPEVARFCQLYLVSVLQKQPSWINEPLPTSPESSSLPNPDDQDACAATPVGKALRSTFHALDRMIDDPSRRQEIMQLRTAKPLAGERKEALNIPPPKDISHIEPPEFYKRTSMATVSIDGNSSSSASSNPIDNEDEKQKGQSDDSTATTETTVVETDSHDVDDKDNSSGDDPPPNDDSVDVEDDDSTEAIGKEEASRIDQDMMDEDDTPSKQATSGVGSNPRKVATMFQKILSLGGGAGQVVVEVDSNMQPVRPVQNLGPNARQPTLVHQGRMICNLPDHHIHAGATAIVAVLTGRILTVANAGDSRAVLCRANGVVQPLSFDHKPQQDRELTRITQAGGFVNHFGRVNGNLNLSRSIGDLKYKQVPGIPPSDQMITAEPDIMQVALLPGDEFIILGCDGIWDCLSNESAVEYVRERIDDKSPTEIGKEMLDDIISVDPRVTQGIGGDNMTVMIVDLRPSDRSWRKNRDLTSEDDVSPNDEK